MSKIETVPDPPPNVMLSATPGLCGHEAAARWCREVLGIEAISARAIKTATDRGELASALFGHRRHYASAEIWRWVTGRVRPATANR